MNLRRRSTTQVGAHAALTAVALIYAGNYFIAKEVFQQLSPAGAVALRTGGSAFIFFLVAASTSQLQKITNRSDLIRIMACALFGAVLNQNFFFAGLNRTTEVNAAVIMTTTPVMVFLVAVFLNTEKLTWIKIAGLGIALAGAVILTINGRDVSLGMDTMTGDLLILANASSYAIYLVLVKPLMARYNVFTIMTWLMGLAAIINVPFGIPDIMAAEWQTMSSTTFWGIAYLIIAVTNLAYGLNAYGLTRVSPSAVGVYIYLQPVIVSVLAAFLPNKGITWVQLGCMLFVCVGVGLVAYRKKT